MGAVDVMDEINDARLMAIAEERMEHFDSSNLVSQEDAMRHLGISEDDLDGCEEVGIE